MNGQICEWNEDEDGVWVTECQELFEFNECGPQENGFKFCPYCGKKLNIIRWTSNADLTNICSTNAELTGVAKRSPS